MRPSRGDVLACLGVRGANPELGEILETQLESCTAEFESAFAPKHVLKKFTAERGENGISLSGTELLLPGRDISALLAGCGECWLMCATAGFEIDRLISRTAAVSKTRALILDACASAGIESYCDQIQDKLEAEELARSKYLTFRYAPGYGDLPIETQRPILRVLDASRRIGVSCGESFLLSPVKSVTAVLGVTDTPSPKDSKCSRCPNYPHCAYRKEGKPCV